MEWIGAVVGGLVGGSMALIASGAIALFRIDREKHAIVLKWTYIVLFGIGLGLTQQFVAPIVKRWYAAETLEKELPEHHELFAALRDYEPATFAAVVEAGKKSLRRGEPSEIVQASVRAKVAQLMRQRIVVAEDSIAHSYMQVLVKEVRELHAGGDDACYRMLFPNSGSPIDIGSRLSADTVAAGARNVVAVIKSAATAPQAPVTQAQVNEELQLVVARMVEKFGDELALLKSQQTTLLAKRRSCEIYAEMFDTVNSFPPAKAGRLIRAVMSAEAQRQ